MGHQIGQKGRDSRRHVMMRHTQKLCCVLLTMTTQVSQNQSATPNPVTHQLTHIVVLGHQKWRALANSYASSSSSQPFCSNNRRKAQRTTAPHQGSSSIHCSFFSSCKHPDDGWGRPWRQPGSASTSVSYIFTTGATAPHMRQTSHGLGDSTGRRTTDTSQDVHENT
jgi:hypothetical protein